MCYICNSYVGQAFIKVASEQVNASDDILLHPTIFMVTCKITIHTLLNGNGVEEKQLKMDREILIGEPIMYGSCHTLNLEEVHVLSSTIAPDCISCCNQICGFWVPPGIISG